MVAVHDEHRPGAPPIGGINEHTPVPGLLDHALDGGRLRADNGDEPAGGDHVAETDIDALRSAAEEFLSGKKTPTSEKDELKKLIKNIETVLDDLPDDHPLRDDFDRLAQLF